MRCLSAILAVALLIAPVAVRAETITIVADSWCPYNCEPDAERTGFMIEIAKRAFAKHNITVEYSIAPWSRAIEDTRQHKHTAIVGAARDDAPDFVFPAIEQGQMRNMFYVKKGNPWRFTGMDSLQKISLGVIAGYSYNDAIDAYLAAHKNDLKFVQMISGDHALDTNIKKLLLNRIGAFLDGEYVVQHRIAQQNLTDQLEPAGVLPSSESDNLYIAFSPKEPKAKAYAAILTKETNAMRTSGELAEILSAYGIRDWKKQPNRPSKKAR